MALQDQSGAHLRISGGAAPTAAAGANNGSTPPAPVVAAGSEDARGSLSYGSGGTAAAGAQVVVTFATPFDTVPTVMLTPNTQATAVQDISVTSVTSQGFTVSANTAPTSSQANTVYGVNWTAWG